MATPDLYTASLSVAPSDAPSDRISADSLNGTSIIAHSNKEDGSSNPEADEPKSAPQPDDHQPTAPFLRRSARRTTRPSYLSPDRAPPRAKAKKRPPLSAKMTAPARRNPKRKANEPSKFLSDLPSDLLSEALKPLEPNEIEEWEGWVELESEPAFFNIILRELGVGNVKVQELFSVDDDAMSFIPKPIFGLIFLFQYQPSLDETQDEDDPGGDLWFANQTTHNACATVALLNIIFNVPQIQLGDALAGFKQSTKPLSTPLRGHRLSSDKFIRSVHNSFTRRMDHLHVDLCTENNANQPKPKKAKTGGKKGSKTASKSRNSEDFAHHFIGFVERDGVVWELDGLKTKPHKLGSVESDDWTSIVRPQLAARMAQYEESELSFNLLALCRSPLANHSRKIAECVQSLRHLHLVAPLKEGVGEDWKPETSIIAEFDKPERLAEFRLTSEAVHAAQIPQWARDQVAKVDTTGGAFNLHQDLEVEVKATMGEFRAEMLEMAQDEEKVRGRRRDYAPALHKWVSKLAEKGVLQDMISTSRT